MNYGMPITLTPKRMNATAITVHQLNVLESEQAQTNWRNFKGVAKPIRNKRTISMYKKVNKMGTTRIRKQGAAWEIDLNNQFEKNTGIVLKVEKKKSKLSEHKYAMNKIQQSTVENLQIQIKDERPDVG